MKTFDQLWEELMSKVASGDSDSGTVTLLESGIHAIGKKIVEEASEVWMAAEFQSKEATALEISQLLYYLQVLAIAKGVELEDIYKEL